MLVRVLILTVAIISTNGFPSPNPDEHGQIEKLEMNFFYDILKRNIDEAINCMLYGVLKDAHHAIQRERVTNRNNEVRVLLTIHKPECGTHDEVCCTLVQEFQNISLKIEISEQNLVSGSTNSQVTQEIVERNFVHSFTNLLAIATHVQVGCAAALLCVEEQFCTTDGTISPEPLSLTSKDLLHRVPLNTCRNPQNGVIGKCCRDPNYIDPWPTENLPKNYSGGFDEQGFPTFLNIAKIRPPKASARPDSQSHNLVPVAGTLESVLIPDNSVISAEVLIPPTKPFQKHEDDLNVETLNLKCGVRNMKSKIQKSETVFAEIPWQAMVLHSKERKILCSGALISNRDVLTAANCIDSMMPDDILIKLGEWKLGYELKYEEPLPYEILNVSSIKIHPGYTNGVSDHDLAVLHLENPATLNRHVNPLCLFKTKQPQKNKSCILTGWGKSILQAILLKLKCVLETNMECRICEHMKNIISSRYEEHRENPNVLYIINAHYAGAIMHAVDMDILSTEQCTEQLITSNLNPNYANRIICGTTKKDINNICEADIGGPLACENKYGFYELVGIYSQDTGCLPTNQVAIFAPSDDDWLKGMIESSTSEQNLSILPEENKTNRGYEEVPFKNDYQKSSLSTNNEYLPPNRRSIN